MNICITSKDFQGNEVDSRFGRAAAFAIYDETGEKIKVINNTAANIAGGAGVKATEKLVDENIQVLITGNIGPHAEGVIGNTGIEVYFTEAGISTKEAFNRWKEGLLLKKS